MKKIFIFPLILISFSVFGQNTATVVPQNTAIIGSNTASLFSVSNTNGGANAHGISGTTSSFSNSGYAIYGNALNNGTGVYGISNTANGVFGASSGGGVGVLGISTSGVGGFFSSGSGYSLITSLGNVGIATTNPNLNSGEIIDVNGRIRVRHQNSPTTTAGIWFNNSSNTIAFNDGSFFGMETATPGSERSGIWIGNAWRFYIDRVGVAKFTGSIDADGYSYFRSGVEICSGDLRVHGNILASGSVLSNQGLFPCPSDFRFKKDIQTLSNSLSKIMQMRGVSYYWKQDEFKERQFSNTKQMGFIAQELEQIIPDVVLTMEDGYKAIDYSKITALLTEAIKDQQKIIDELKSKNQKLESRLERIEAMLQK